MNEKPIMDLQIGPSLAFGEAMMEISDTVSAKRVSLDVIYDEILKLQHKIDLLSEPWYKRLWRWLNRGND
jgi:hypothetical protein